MHICFSTIDYHQNKQGGGIASYLDALAPQLVAQGHQVTIVGPGSKKKDFINEHGVRLVLLPLGSWHWYAYRLKLPSWLYLPLREWEWSRSLYQAIRQLHVQQPIDIIESHEVGLWQLLRKRHTLPPVLVRLHGSPFIFKSFSGQKPNGGEKLIHRLELKWLKTAAGISAPGRFQAHYYQDLLGQSVATIPNPIAPRFLEKVCSVAVKPSAPHILYTGRIEYRKGSLVLVQAFDQVLREFPQAQLVIAGARHNSISAATWQKTIAEAGVGQNLQELGHIPFAELRTHYQQAQVFVMPSYYETFGISVIEAMAQGLPVVAAQAGALPELVEDGQNGLTVPPGDAEALAQALVELLRQPQKAHAFGAAGQKKVHQHYTPQAVAQQLIDFYQKALYR